MQQITQIIEAAAINNHHGLANLVTTDRLCKMTTTGSRRTDLRHVAVLPRELTGREINEQLSEDRAIELPVEFFEPRLISKADRAHGTMDQSCSTKYQCTCLERIFAPGRR